LDHAITFLSQNRG